MSQLWGMSKIPASAANCGLLAKFSSVSFRRRWVRSASGDDGRKLFQHVRHRGPVYKGLGAMNPCDHLDLDELNCVRFRLALYDPVNLAYFNLYVLYISVDFRNLDKNVK
jgi:hypothetical protein